MFSQKSFMEGCVNYVTDFPGEQDVSFNYDGLGKRRNKLVDGDATWWRWAGWSIVSEYDGGTTQTDWDPGDRELGYIPGLGQFTGDSGAGYDYAFFLQDHLGSTRNVLDESKNLLASLSYTPYGEELQFGGKLPSPRYTGHHWDAETGMYFAPFRHYMPGAGRWLSRDPIGMAGGVNQYGYVGSNPVATIDLLGLFSQELCDMIRGWLDSEEDLGTWETAVAASDYGYLGIGNPGYGSIDNRPIDTAIGPIDMHYWLDQIALSHLPFTFLSRMPIARHINSHASYLLVRIGGSLSSEGWDWPYADPAERNSVRAVSKGYDRFYELFPPDLMKRECGDTQERETHPWWRFWN